MENGKRLPAISAVLKWVFIGFLGAVLVTPTKIVSGAYAFGGAVFCAAALLLFTGTAGWLRGKLNGAFLLSSLGLTALFLLQLSASELFSGFELLSAKLGDASKILKLVALYKPAFLVFLALAAYIVIGSALNLALSGARCAREDEAEPRRLPLFGIYCIALPVVIVTALYVLASYPSYDYPDIKNVLLGIETNAWSEWHTTAFMLFCKIFSLGARQKYFIEIFQGIFWIYICNYGLGTMYRLLKSKKLCFAYSIALAAIFTPAIYCGIIVKDTIHCMSHFFFFIALFDFLSAEDRTARNYIVLACAAVAASIFRHAAFAPVLCTLIALCIYMARRARCMKKLAALLLVVIICVTFAGTILPREILHAERNPAYVKYSVPMYLIGALSNKIDAFDEEDLAVMEKFMPLERWREISAENRYAADPVSRDWGGIGESVKKLNDPATGREVILLNLRLLLKYPRQYISSAFDISSIIWEIGRPFDGYEWAPLEGGAIDYREGDAGIQRNVSTVFTRSLSDVSFRNPVLNPVFWRGGFWLFVLAFSAVVLMLKRQYRYMLPLLLPGTAVLLLFLSIPAQDPRYILFLIECGLFAAFFSVCAPKRGIAAGDAEG